MKKGVVSTQSRFTSIPIRQRGQPCFARPAEDEPANGPVVTYHLSPEEIARRYGPPMEVQCKSRKPKLDKQSLAGMLLTLTVNEVAWRYQLPQRYVIKLCEIYGLELDEKGRLKEDENVNNQSTENVQAAENQGSGFKTYPANDGQKKTRLEIAREKLSKEKYLELNGQGLLDKDIREQCDIHGDVLCALKKEWDLIGDKAKETIGTKMTIAEALKLREEMLTEIACVEEIHDKVELPPKLEVIIADHHNECSATLDKINHVLDTVVVEIEV